MLVARSADKLAALAEELAGQGHDALPLPADMRDPAAVGQMIEAGGRALWPHRHPHQQRRSGGRGNRRAGDPDDYRQIIELNLFGPLYAMQAAVPKMRQGGGGLIINISSMVTKMHIPGLAAYASTKSALNMLSDTAWEGARQHPRDHRLSAAHGHRFRQEFAGPSADAAAPTTAYHHLAQSRR